MTRNNFTKTHMRDMRARSGGVCEAGTGGTETFYGMQPGERCEAKATAFDHVTADALKRTKIKDIGEGKHVCRLHHHIKTQTHDMPKIRKAKRIDEARAGIPRKAMKAVIPSRPKRQPEPVISSFGNKGEAKHRAEMAAKQKRIPPRRFTGA